MDVPYPVAADSPDIDFLIDQTIDRLIKECLTSLGHTPMCGQVNVLFSVKDPSKPKKKSGWFGHVKELASKDMPVWEKWTVNVNCLSISGDTDTLSDGDGIMNRAERLLHLSATSFESNLLRIIELVDKHKSHVPPILSLDVAPFPYTISVSSADKRPDDETWGDFIKKIMD